LASPGSFSGTFEVFMAEQTILCDTRYLKKCLGTERRTWSRFPSEQDLSCQPAVCLHRSEVGTTWLGRVVDISRTGIGFATSRWFEPGTVLTIVLSDEPKGLLLQRPARVIHAMPKRKSRWMIGCEFVSPLSDDDLQTLVGE
jgi:PilZ domain